MISRRSFLKVSGLAAVALGTGFGTNKLIHSRNSKYFGVHGFIPGDENIVKLLVKSFNDKTGFSDAPVIFADAKWANIIRDKYKLNSGSDGRVTFRMIKINGIADSDILITDNNNVVYNPDNDFNSAFIKIRTNIQNRKADYLFSAQFKKDDLLSSFLKSGEKLAVIENEKGIIDRIDLTRNYKNIVIDGKLGKTGISVNNGFVNVHTSSCRNQICKESGFISEPGQLIACAPNKIVIRVEAV